MTSAEPRAKVTTHTLLEMKERGEKIVALTAYDCPTARLEDASGVEVILVGDSLGQVVLGHSSTLPVTLEDMIHHTHAVTRASPRALVVADMPFMSYQVSVESALANAGRLIREAGAEAVKLEGGRHVLPQVRALVDAGIPCMGHLGLTPQSILRFGGYRVQGKDPAAAAAMRRDAAALEDAGCFSLVLEAIPWTLAEEITAERRIPTIGIGAGAGCDGQVLVVHDLLGIFEEFTPRFVKRYAELGREMRLAFGRYVAEVKSGVFPDRERSYSGGRTPRSRAGRSARKGRK
jgi:3-methyl-2-oxobutanoate hydroxymethyltransferase